VTRDGEGFFGTHLPVLFDAERGRLDGHIARANPHHGRAGDGEALMIFQGPNAYVSPSWYPSKAVHGRVVPTWNYEVVHVTGTITWRPEPEWLRPHLAALTNRFEQGRPEPWALTDAPDDYIARQLSAIVGMELAVRTVRVKRKLSQNRAPEDRQGVIDGLDASTWLTDADVARRMEETE
jgi:transcriptional regulator